LITSPSLSSWSILHGGIGMWIFCALIVAYVRISSPVSIASTLSGCAATFVFIASLARARPWMWSASACVATIILHADRLKSILRIRSMISSAVSSQPTSISSHSDPPSIR
jgi:hypothetical protein